MLKILTLNHNALAILQDLKEKSEVYLFTCHMMVKC